MSLLANNQLSRENQFLKSNEQASHHPTLLQKNSSDQALKHSDNNSSDSHLGYNTPKQLNSNIANKYHSQTPSKRSPDNKDDFQRRQKADLQDFNENELKAQLNSIDQLIERNDKSLSDDGQKNNLFITQLALANSANNSQIIQKNMELINNLKNQNKQFQDQLKSIRSNLSTLVLKNELFCKDFSRQAPPDQKLLRKLAPTHDNDALSSEPQSPKVSKSELENTYKLLDAYQKENKKLQQRLYEDGNSIEKIIKLENQLSQKVFAIEQLKQENQAKDQEITQLQDNLKRTILHNSVPNLGAQQIENIQNQLNEIMKEKRELEDFSKNLCDFCNDIDRAYSDQCRENDKQPKINFKQFLTEQQHTAPQAQMLKQRLELKDSKRQTRPVSQHRERMNTIDENELYFNYAADGEEDEFNIIFCEQNFNNLIKRAKELKKYQYMCEKSHQPDILNMKERIRADNLLIEDLKTKLLQQDREAKLAAHRLAQLKKTIDYLPVPSSMMAKPSQFIRPCCGDGRHMIDLTPKDGTSKENSLTPSRNNLKTPQFNLPYLEVNESNNFPVGSFSPRSNKMTNPFNQFSQMKKSGALDNSMTPDANHNLYTNFNLVDGSRFYRTPIYGTIKPIDQPPQIESKDDAQLMETQRRRNSNPSRQGDLLPINGSQSARLLESENQSGYKPKYNNKKENRSNSSIGKLGQSQQQWRIQTSGNQDSQKSLKYPNLSNMISQTQPIETSQIGNENPMNSQMNPLSSNMSQNIYGDININQSTRFKEQVDSRTILNRHPKADTINGHPRFSLHHGYMFASLKEKNFVPLTLREEDVGQEVPGCQKFSDRIIFQTVYAQRINKITVWTDDQGVAGIKVTYKVNGNDNIEGGQHVRFSAKYQNNYTVEHLLLADDDYLQKVSGTINKFGQIACLELVSDLGDRKRFGQFEQTSSQSFRFDISEPEVPICIYGALVVQKNLQSEIIASQLIMIGFQIVKNEEDERIDTDELEPQSLYKHI